MAQEQQRIIVVVGPTASGKSALAVEIARRVGGEVISADSRQVYRGLNIGTGKITRREMQGVPHYLLNVASPKNQFTAHDYSLQARLACSNILQNDKIPIICGGTGFYIDALVGRADLPDVAPNADLRQNLESLLPEELFRRLEIQDPTRAQSIDPHNKRRLIRALEIIDALGKNPLPAPQERYRVKWIGLKPEMATLKERINARLRQRLGRGMVAEARSLHDRGLSYKRMHDLGLEYRSLARHLQGAISRKELEAELQIAIWQYAKRQMTYWRRNANIQWFSLNEHESILRSVSEFLR